MHKVLAVFVTVALIFSLSACQTGSNHGSYAIEGYQYFPATDEHYAYISLSTELYPSSLPGIELPYITFGSIDEMINDLRTGNFSDEELRKLGGMRVNESDIIPLVHLDELYTVNIPDGVMLKGFEWTAFQRYYILMKSTKGEPIRITNYGTELALEQGWLNCQLFNKESIISKTFDPELAETVIVGYKGSQIMTKKTYSKQISGIVYKMYEEYVRTEEGEDVLRRIVAYVYQNDQYYYSIAIGSPQQHYGADFFAQFELIPYIPEHSL